MVVVHYWLNWNESEFSGLSMDSIEKKEKSSINHKRSMKSADITQEGSSWF